MTTSERHGTASADVGSIDLLTRDEILGAQDIAYEYVQVPEWPTKSGKPGMVRVKALAAIERDDFEKSLVLGQAGKTSRVDTANIRAKLCSRAIVDSAGRRMFTDEDVMALGAKSAAALDRVYEVAARLSKISNDDIEELKGNSSSDPSGASLSGSPSKN